MAKHKYKLLVDPATVNLQRFAGVQTLEQDAEVDLDLSREERRDVVAAGWVEALDDDEDDEPAKTKKGGAK